MTYMQAEIELNKIAKGISNIPFISYAAIVPKYNNSLNEYRIEFGIMASDKFGPFNSSFKFTELPTESRKEELKKFSSSIKNLFNLDSYIPRLSMGITQLNCKTKSLERYKHLSLKGGISIGNLKNPNTAGTLGGILKLKNDSNIYGISNYHVTKDEFLNNKNIIHPSKSDTWFTKEKYSNIGQVVWENYDNLDVSLIKLTSTNFGISSGDRINNRPLQGLGNVNIFETVNKCGRTTSYTESNLISKKAIINIIGRPNKTFKNVFMTKELGCSGDSGSLVLNKKREAVGILIAHDELSGRSFFHDINLIFNDSCGNDITSQKPPFYLEKFI